MLVHATAARMPFKNGSIHFGITSPPFYGLRAYAGVIPQVWGGDPFCQHEWGDWQESHDIREESDHGKSRTTDRFYGDESRRFNGNHEKHVSGTFCRKCGAWYGHLGNEPTPAMFVANLVTVGREMMRVLHPQGVWVLNLGDSFANVGKWGGSTGGKHVGDLHGDTGVGRTKHDYDGFKPKDKMLIPHRVAMALQESGWYVRQEMPWIKKNSMPESTTDRPTTAHEYLFLLTKSERYYWDNEGIKQPVAQASIDRVNQPNFVNQTGGDKDYRNGTNPNRSARKTLENFAENPATRQYRTTDPWLVGLDALIAEQQAYLDHLLQIRSDGGLLVDLDGDPLAVRVASQPFAGAHYAVFPPALIEPLIKGGTSERGCCPVCGKAWERVVEKYRTLDGKPVSYLPPMKNTDISIPSSAQGVGHWRTGSVTKSVAWQPTCDCRTIPDDDGKLRYPQPVAPIVLDCFTGSGTTGKVCATLTAQGHKLRFIGLDLSAEYLSKHASLRAEGKVTAAALAEAEKQAKERYVQEKRPGKEVQEALKAGQTTLF